MRVGVAVIGAGDFGARHLTVLQAHPGAALRWVCDIRLARARAMAEQFGASGFTADFREVLADPAVDAVFVLTPEHLHAPQTLEALAAGKHVLVEKPAASRPEEADAMAQAAAERGLVLMPGHLNRFVPAIARARQSLQEPGMGEPVSLFARKNIPRARLGLHNRTHPVLMALSHDIDLALWFIGRPALRVFAVERTTQPGLTNPDLFWGLIEFEGGCVAVLESLWMLPNESRYVQAEMEIACPGGIIQTRIPGDGLSVETPAGIVYPDTRTLFFAGGRWQGALYDEIDHFLRAAAGEAGPLVVTMEEAAEGLRVAHALMEAARAGSAVSLPARPKGGRA
jgi:UDP-N-acetylglucosamine 3-dehydrogenase